MQLLEKYVEPLFGKKLEPIETVDEIDGELDYTQTRLKFLSLHRGQLKLVLNEIQFLTNHGFRSRFVIYAGSAPNMKGGIVADLFPHTIVCVDPSPHHIIATEVVYLKVTIDGSERIRYLLDDQIIDTTLTNAKSLPVSSYMIAHIRSQSPKRIYVYNDFFDNELATKFSELNPLFISDIRTNRDGLFNDEAPSDLDVVWNNQMVLEWVQRLNPVASMLKMRFPYWARSEMDYFHKNYRGKISDLIAKDYFDRGCRYIVGTEYLQAFAGSTSGETRLVFVGEPVIGTIHTQLRERKLFYYNLIRRQYGFHNHTLNSALCIDGCGDCGLAMKILSRVGDPHELMRRILTVTGRTLTSGVMFTRPLTNKQLLYSFQQTIEYDIAMRQLKLTPSSFQSVKLSIEELYSHMKHMYVYLSKYKDLPLDSYRQLVNITYMAARTQLLTRADFSGLYRQKLNANGLNVELYRGAVSVPSIPVEPTTETVGDIMRLRYRDLTVDTKPVDSPSRMLKCVLFDHYRLSQDGFYTMPDGIRSILDKMNVIEIYTGCYDRMYCVDKLSGVDKRSGVTNTVGFSALEGFGKPLSEFTMAEYDKPGNCILLNTHGMNFYYYMLRHKLRHAILCGVSTLPEGYYPIRQGIGYDFPYNAVKFDGSPATFYAATIRFLFTGPPDKLLNEKIMGSLKT